MGDRANVAILQQKKEEGAVILYTHSGGYCLPEDVRVAISRANGRRDDHQYFARIVFCEMVKEDVEGTTGFGITTTIWDNSYPIIVLDCNRQKVYGADEKDIHTPTGPTMTFDEYAALGKAEWKHLNSDYQVGGRH